MIKLISLNIERSKHLGRIIPFIRSERPDAVSLQEVFEDDLGRLSRDLGLPHSLWLKDRLIDGEKSDAGKSGYSGLAIFSRIAFGDSGAEYYYMPGGGIRLEGSPEEYPETNAQGVVWVSLESGGERYTIANTHFTWSRDGVATARQRTDFEALRERLDTLPEHVLSGDFNAPRGYGVWEWFVEYSGKDNIPPAITSTIDPKWHRSPGLELVVDGIFSMPSYLVRDVRVVPGLSDHQAIVAKVERRCAL